MFKFIFCRTSAFRTVLDHIPRLPWEAEDLISVDLITCECIQNVGELEETLKRLQNHKGVTGVIVIDGKVPGPKMC